MKGRALEIREERGMEGKFDIVLLVNRFMDRREVVVVVC